MRTKLLLSAALAATMSLGAFADDSPIEKPDKTPIPVEPEMAMPIEPGPFKTAPTADDLFDRIDAGGETNEFAQETRISQTGTDNVATADQTEAVEGLAHIRQNGNDNVAVVFQEDDGVNNAPPLFNEPTGLAVIGQVGGGNFASVDQNLRVTPGPANTAAIHQFAPDGEAFLSNSASIVQSGALGESIGSTATITQGTDAERAINNSAFISQMDGDGMTAQIDQQSDGSDATITQINAANAVASVQQDGFAGAGTFSANTALVNQFDATGLLTVEVYQDNDGGVDGLNDIVINQTEGGHDGNVIKASQINDGNFADIFQAGESNEILLEQNDGPNVGLNSADLVQDGTDNLLKVKQFSVSNTATVFQLDNTGGTIVVDQSGETLGGDNSTLINQIGTTDSNVNLVQFASAPGFFAGPAVNDALITQIADESTVNVQQIGLGNTADVFQAGSDNLLTVNQGGFDTLGFGNNAFVTQTGEGNELYLEQDGTLNDADLDQSGFDNELYVEQSGLLNTATVVQAMDNNSAHIFQTGLGNDATVNQVTDNYQVALVVQDGGFNTANIDQ